MRDHQLDYTLIGRNRQLAAGPGILEVEEETVVQRAECTTPGKESPIVPEFAKRGATYSRSRNEDGSWNHVWERDPPHVTSPPR